jgi:hypothetical protein
MIISCQLSMPSARRLCTLSIDEHRDDRDIGKTARAGAALIRRGAHILGFYRAPDRNIIALRRSNSTHLHQPWRANANANSAFRRSGRTARVDQCLGVLLGILERGECVVDAVEPDGSSHDRSAINFALGDHMQRVAEFERGISEDETTVSPANAAACFARASTSSSSAARSRDERLSILF